MVEVEPVHLGADQVVVDLLGDRPLRDVDCLESALVVLQALPLGFHRLGRVVGHAVHDGRFLEDAELLEELQQVVVGTGRGFFGGWRRRGAGDRQREQESERSEAESGVPHDGSSSIRGC